MNLTFLKYSIIILLLQFSFQVVSQSTFGYGYDIPDSPTSYETAPKALVKYNDSTYVGVINYYYSETHILFMVNEKGKLLWIKKLGLDKNYFRDIKVLSDKSILVLFSGSGNSLFMKSILIKFNKNGNKIWARKLSDYFIHIAPSNNGGMILTGAGSINIFSLDSAGNSINSQKLHFHYHHIQDITTDTNYVSTFISINMQTQIGTQLMIGTFDSSAIIANKKFYSFSNYIMAASYVRLIDKKQGGHYALLSQPTPNPTLLLINFDKNNDINWAKKIFLPNFVLNSFPTPDIVLTSNNGCLISTEFQMPAINYTLYSPLFIHIDSNGTLISSKTVEDTASISWVNHKIYAMTQANSPNHFMAVGIGNRMDSQNNWQQIYSDLYIYRFNLNLDGFCDTTSIHVNIIPSIPSSDTIYVNLYYSKPHHFFKLNYYYNTSNIPAYTYDICSFNLLDSINTGSIYKAKPINIKTYPNPANKVIYIKPYNGQAYHYIIYNALGQNVLQGNNTSNSISIESLKTGYYILHIKTKTKSYLQKFSVLK